MSRSTSPAMRATPTTDPMTIPAMAPPDNPFFEADAPGVAEAVAEDDEVGDAVGELVENVMKAVIVGKTTPTHRVCAWEL